MVILNALRSSVIRKRMKPLWNRTLEIILKNNSKAKPNSLNAMVIGIIGKIPIGN